MRPVRFLLTVTSCIVAFFLLLVVGPWHNDDGVEDDRGGIGTYFNWRTPSSLFPPSAIISITDDNSTNFVARPAAFGPLLPVKSLSGQLWIGSGFGNDHIGRGGSGAGAGGELGCSDVPGWDDGSWSSTKKSISDGKSAATEGQGPLAGNSKRDYPTDDEDEETPDKEHPTEDDGTDDHLHHPLPASDGIHVNGNSAGNTKKPTHADIQSLQESAEIAGKVVLLSRGGCGFLEKVKWVQRRGGIALIVGDDIRGGPLVTMYARGDTSNVTIPSLFTSYTTAQLLSSLMPAGGNTIVESNKIVVPVLGQKSVHGKASDDKPNFTTTAASSKATSVSQAKKASKKDGASSQQKAGGEVHRHRAGWFASLLGHGTPDANSRRPPSSGKPGWVQQKDFDDDTDHHKDPKQVASSGNLKKTAAAEQSGPEDGFVIGVQDWRDPDLVAEQKEQHLQESTSSSSVTAEPKSTAVEASSLKGGSITPGSGEYSKAHHEAVEIESFKAAKVEHEVAALHNEAQEASRSWIGRLFGSGHKEHADSSHLPLKPAQPEQDAQHGKAETVQRKPHLAGGAPHHDGLWVTLSQTSMSSSPFFDTLLVLVVSPLVTLTVVYALLLLRSRIRRRRWRAPKSVVERLPVRTYQTMPSSTGSTTSISSQASATTPLLPASRPISTRSRPRARTASDLPQSSGSLRSDGMASPSLEQIEEKRAAGLAEWRRRYGGKQRECVVCLEEYVDGVSRVMSLPCGHEFHAECITPWLTTRRRTCPICKGDVVRSLARSGGSSSATSPPQHLHEPYRDEEDEVDVQEQAVNLVNDDPDSQQPVSREDEAFEDLERGLPDRNR
ncbi:Putative Zinc finger, RING-type, PA domain, Zinc finger, RING-CH-type [Septoria linicola]|uniref:RING-type E3 ubiquitin transferase n=1 Tax=Septoria linicola TaxID=215465 RepID=A0A9Q9EIV6_9PEZI|nr:putative Zinc finger, RING-type, PA domain, Zinc finger, RING-CH-type [Septoria linicola]USW50733.1 Putative Zinc finger, RING-type, PA domain, Zinc finger, RING-CH-type [Septoria linicola]